MVLNLWQHQYSLYHNDDDTKMEQPRLPNRTIIRDDVDVTPIISHQQHQICNSKNNLTCDKVHKNYYCKNKNQKLWTFSTATTIPVKLKLLSKRICSSQKIVKKCDKNDATMMMCDNIGSDLLGKCKNFNSRGKKTIFWQCCLIFMYIILMNLSTSTCFAARNEGKSNFLL